MSDRIAPNKQPKIKFLEGIPNMEFGKKGDIVVTKDSGEIFLGIKTIDEWRVVPLQSFGSSKDFEIENLIVKAETTLRGNGSF